MARVVKPPRSESPPESARTWLEGCGLLWEGMTPAQVWDCLTDDGMSPDEAAAYVEGLRGTEAGSLMLWDRPA